MAVSPRTPGVYIQEENTFPTRIVPAATAVPVFIGYTPQALYQGQSAINLPVRISSFADFQATFGNPGTYYPQYYLVKQNKQPASGNYMVIDGSFYPVVCDPDTLYYTYNSVKLFYQNGGGDAYIMSVGTYAAPGKDVPATDAPQVNNHVLLNDLLNGVALLKNVQGPTMYICPEATLLTVENNATLMQAMLLQCSQLQTAICLFDIIGGKNPDPVLYTNDISTFRNNTGATGLDFGAAYYPFVGTTIVQPQDIAYTNFFGGDAQQLAPLLSPADNPNPQADAILNTALSPNAPLSVAQYNAQLIAASTTYNSIIKQVLPDVNLLPVSGAMAGVITMTDTSFGVWQAPANVSIVGVVSLPIKLNDAQQANLNVDAVSGKSINAIRSFPNTGILVWGARTLDGNSQDWRYIQVKRTVMMLEQSCKQALNAYVFAPNDQATWAAVTAQINNFLTGIWQQGGLLGAAPADAFSVACGLGSTMTGKDILTGLLIVSVSVAVVHPAEFIVITLEQQIQGS